MQGRIICEHGNYYFRGGIHIFTEECSDTRRAINLAQLSKGDFMKVYKFSDYIKNGVGNPMPESAVVCEIETMRDFPQSLCELNGKKVHVCMFGADSDYACIDYIEEMPKVSELLFEHEITCPHCGNQSSDSWEYSDSDDEHDCDVCGSVFSYQREVEVTYSSTIVKVNDEIIKLNLTNELLT